MKTRGTKPKKKCPVCSWELYAILVLFLCIVFCCIMHIREIRNDGLYTGARVHFLGFPNHIGIVEEYVPIKDYYAIRWKDGYKREYIASYLLVKIPKEENQRHENGEK